MIHDIKNVVDTWSMLSDLGWPLWDHPFSSSHLHGYKIDKFDQLRNLFCHDAPEFVLEIPEYVLPDFSKLVVISPFTKS